jgi:ABC-type arginine/histidine transport system permease subunit
MYYDKIVVSSGSMAANTACGLAKRLALRRILCPNTFDPKHPLSDGLHTH